MGSSCWRPHFGQGANPYANQSDASRAGVLAAPLVIAEPLVDISNLGGGITDFEEAYTGEVNVASDSGLPITADDEWIFGSPYVELNLGAVNSPANVACDLGGGITADDEWIFGSPFVELNLGAVTPPANVASDLGDGITDFEEAYTSKVSLLQTQNEQANIFPEVEL